MTLALNYLIAFLLLLTILFCWKLNRKIVAIHKSKKEMLALLKYFDNAVVRAEESIKQLKHASTSAGKLLQTDIEKAQLLVNDLNFMIERAATTADKLETSIATSREVPSFATSSTSRSPSTETRAPSFRLTPSSKLSANKPLVDTTDAQKERTASKRSSIEILLERLAGKEPSVTKVPKEQRIAYQSPETLGAMELPATGNKNAPDKLMQLLNAVNEGYN